MDEEYWGDDDYAPTKNKQKNSKIKCEDSEDFDNKDDIYDSSCADKLIDADFEIRYDSLYLSTYWYLFPFYIM